MKYVEPDWRLMDEIKEELKESFFARQSPAALKDALEFLKKNAGDYSAIEKEYGRAEKGSDLHYRNLLAHAVSRLSKSKEIPYQKGDIVRFIGGDCEVVRLFTNYEGDKKVELRPLNREATYLTSPYVVEIIREEQIEFDLAVE